MKLGFVIECKNAGRDLWRRSCALIRCCFIARLGVKEFETGGINQAMKYAFCPRTWRTTLVRMLHLSAICKIQQYQRTSQVNQMRSCSVSKACSKKLRDWKAATNQTLKRKPRKERASSRFYNWSTSWRLKARHLTHYTCAWFDERRRRQSTMLFRPTADEKKRDKRWAKFLTLCCSCFPLSLSKKQNTEDFDMK